MRCVLGSEGALAVVVDFRNDGVGVPRYYELTVTGKLQLWDGKLDPAPDVRNPLQMAQTPDQATRSVDASGMVSK